MRKRTKNPLPQKLNGYQKLPRDRFVILVKNQGLLGGEFLLLEFLLAITDWDKNHKTYASFDARLDEISEVLGIPRSTVGYQLAKLRAKGLIFDGDDGRVHIKDFEKLIWSHTNPNHVSRLAEGLTNEIDDQDIGEEIQIPEQEVIKEDARFKPG